MTQPKKILKPVNMAVRALLNSPLPNQVAEHMQLPTNPHCPGHPLVGLQPTGNAIASGIHAKQPAACIIWLDIPGWNDPCQWLGSRLGGKYPLCRKLKFPSHAGEIGRFPCVNKDETKDKTEMTPIE